MLSCRPSLALWEHPNIAHTLPKCAFSVLALNLGPQVHACVLSCFSQVRLFVTLWTVAHQAPLSMGSPRQEYWSGLPSLSPRDLSDPGIKPGFSYHCRQIVYYLGHRLRGSPQVPKSSLLLRSQAGGRAQSFHGIRITHVLSPSTWFCAFLPKRC